jgi:hypothetical protein
MAIRIRSSFHSRTMPRSEAELASVVAALAWKLAQASLKRMRAASFDIDLGRAYFDFVCEHLAFLAHLADRIAYRELDAPAREAFTRALAGCLAQLVEENGDMLLGTAEAGWCQRHFLDLFNAAGGDYAECSYGSGGPDFAFRRCFATRVQAGLPLKDRLWVADQVMEIEVPEDVRTLEQTLASLFHPQVANTDATEAGSARRRKTVMGD